MPRLGFYEFYELLCKNGFKWVIIGLLGLTHWVLGWVGLWKAEPKTQWVGFWVGVSDPKWVLPKSILN